MSLAACAGPPAAAIMSSWPRIERVIIAPVLLSPPPCGEGQGWGSGSRDGEDCPTLGFASLAVPPHKGEGVEISRRTLRLEIRMYDSAVAGERRRLDDVVVPVDRKRLGLLVDQ